MKMHVLRAWLVAVALSVGLMTPHSADAQGSLVSARLGTGKVVTIRDDRGGDLVAYARTVNKIRLNRQLVRVSGRCESACTLVLSLPPEQLCIARGASFGFHRAYGSSATMNKWGTEYMLKSYPGWVRSWINEAGGLTSRMKHMRYGLAAQALRSCDDRRQVARS